MCTGETIKKLRLLKGYNQKGVAQEMGISQQAYSKLEKNGHIGGKRLLVILKILRSSEREIDMINNIPGN
jgi:transcriptional regulator with XRE-family HTH domain